MDEVIVDIPKALYRGSAPDMGAYEYNGEPTIVSDTESVPIVFYLRQNYPNPFNTVTIIPFILPSENHVKLKIYNILGELVSIMIDERIGAGQHELKWNASMFSSGIYFYRIEAGRCVSTKTLLLLK